jgi:hypothetical protein
MENRRKYIDIMVARLKELESEIRELEVIADKAVAEVKADYRKQINGLFLKKEELKKKVTQIKEATGNAWEDIKAGAELSWEVLNDSVKPAKQKKGSHLHKSEK